jgi:hypothetical protein
MNGVKEALVALLLLALWKAATQEICQIVISKDNAEAKETMGRVL